MNYNFFDGMCFYVIGFDYNTMPIELRSKVSINNLDIPDIIIQIKATTSIKDVVILSTCNRTEIYFIGSDKSEMFDFLSNLYGFTREQIVDFSYVYMDSDAVSHACLVASGGLSMVLGEPQIFGQFKDAIRLSESKDTSVIFRNIFDYIVQTTKEIRTNTAIGRSNISYASISLGIIKKIFGDMKLDILFLGSGEMIEVAAETMKESAKNMTFTNRTITKSMSLADKYSGKNLLLNNMIENLYKFDVVVTSTSSTLPIIGYGSVKTAIKKRNNKPMLFVDMGLPCDVETEINELDNVFIYNIDDLGKIAQDNCTNRYNAIEDARRIIEVSLSKLYGVLYKNKNAWVISEFKKFVNSVVNYEKNKIISRISDGENIEAAIDSSFKTLSAKLIHGYMHGLTKLESQEERDSFKKVITEVYNITKN